MKRFWTAAAVVAEAGGFAIRLDTRPVRTPARAPLAVPTRALAEAIAAEWDAVADAIDPRAMPLTGLANAAIDRVAADAPRFVASLAAYAQSDTLLYGAAEPPELIARETAAWEPLLAWAMRRYDVRFERVTGIVHRAQPPATIARLAAALEGRDAFALAGLSPLVTIGGSLIAALAVAEGAADPDAAFDAAHVDELWQAEVWGEEWSSAEARAARRADFSAAAHFLRLLA